MRTALIILSLWFTQMATATTISIPAAGRTGAMVYVPQQYTATKSWPVILLLHGYTSTGFLMNLYFGLSEQVDARGYILIVPNGKKDGFGYQYWNATDACCDFGHSGVDDVGYLEGLLADVESRYNVDKSQVFSVGHSNGAFMSYRLACEADSPFASIVSFAGETFLKPSDCKATHPVSVLQIQALDDDTILYNGDPVGYPGLAPYPGTLNTMAQWVAIDGCAPTPVAGSTLQITYDNETQTQQWLACSSGVRIGLDMIQPYTSLLHSPHTPILTDEFTKHLLDFLFQ